MLVQPQTMQTKLDSANAEHAALLDAVKVRIISRTSRARTLMTPHTTCRLVTVLTSPRRPLRCCGVLVVYL
jgi:hypothetical protein